MMQLHSGALLQGGRYKIERMLGQGGFGITYLAVQTGLNRRVAVKEFFMKDLCNRDETTSHVSVPSTGSREQVGRFKHKFLKEAQTIASFDYAGIARIHDIFEENGTAYYVMEYLDGGSLDDRIPAGGMKEAEALRVIRMVGNALSYIHSQNVLHLDVKPSNILFRQNGDAVLIDFGISKRYDDAGGQTSTTPVGLSKGYAPLEQYNQGLQSFSPSTDIYSLGATLYKMLTGQTPPEASMVNEEGLPACPSRVSSNVWNAVEQAMQPRRKDRPQSAKAFMGLLENEPKSESEDHDENKDSTYVPTKDDDTVISGISVKGKGKEPTEPTVPSRTRRIPRMLLYWAILVISGIIILYIEIGKMQDGPFSDAKVENILSRIASDMVYVEGGTFLMGATSEQGSEAYDDEKPTHNVTLSSFYISAHEVTQAEWEAVMDGNPSHFKGSELPVESVSWDDCQEFINKLNSLTGKNYRLPTEAEWEYAARGGSKSLGFKYSGSNALGDVAWYTDNSGSKTHPVKSKQSNELGLYDMSGNVLEWCQDWSGSYTSNSQPNPSGPVSGSYRVIRGGCWDRSAWLCRVSNRNSKSPSLRVNYLGLRLAR